MFDWRRTHGVSRSPEVRTSGKMLLKYIGANLSGADIKNVGDVFLWRRKLCVFCPNCYEEVGAIPNGADLKDVGSILRWRRTHGVVAPKKRTFQKYAAPTAMAPTLVMSATRFCGAENCAGIYQFCFENFGPIPNGAELKYVGSIARGAGIC